MLMRRADPLPNAPVNVLILLSKSRERPEWLNHFTRFRPDDDGRTAALYLQIRKRIFTRLTLGRRSRIEQLRHELITERILNHQNNGLFFTALAEVRTLLAPYAEAAH